MPSSYPPKNSGLSCTRPCGTAALREHSEKFALPNKFKWLLVKKRQSKIVLGGHSLLKLEPKPCSEFLSFALENGIDEIDSAPSYPNLEDLLGSLSFLGSSFKVNSKVGLPNQDFFKKGQILKEVDSSLKSLKITRFETVFVHSAPFTHLSDFVFEELLQLKLLGLANRIGYSSSSNKSDLDSAVNSNIFDSYQITLNLLDQSNLQITPRIYGKHIYWKRIFGSGVIDDRYLNRMKLYTKSVLGLTNRFDQNGYQFRYLKLFGVSPFQRDMHTKFQRFAMCQTINSKVIIGTTNISHLSQALACEKNMGLKESLDGCPLSVKFSELERKYGWTPRD